MLCNQCLASYGYLVLWGNKRIFDWQATTYLPRHLWIVTLLENLTRSGCCSHNKHSVVKVTKINKALFEWLNTVRSYLSSQMFFIYFKQNSEEGFIILMCSIKNLRWERRVLHLLTESKVIIIMLTMCSGLWRICLNILGIDVAFSVYIWHA